MTTPADPITDPLAVPTATTALAHLMTELAKTTAGAPKHTRITPGLALVAALSDGVDECCEGIASVRVARIFQTEIFPDPATRPNSQEGPMSWGVEVELAVARCGAEPGSDMDPTDASITADSQVILDDAAAMRRVAACYDYDTTYPIIDAVAGEWVPMEAEGNCIGGMMTITLQVECGEC